MKFSVSSPVGVWAVVVVVLLGVGVEQPQGTEGAAAPHSCCRRGRFAAVTLGFIGVRRNIEISLLKKGFLYVILFIDTNNVPPMTRSVG